MDSKILQIIIIKIIVIKIIIIKIMIIEIFEYSFIRWWTHLILNNNNLWKIYTHDTNIIILQIKCLLYSTVLLYTTIVKYSKVQYITLQDSTVGFRQQNGTEECSAVCFHRIYDKLYHFNKAKWYLAYRTVIYSTVY